ncbi:MAG: sensor histidine kinase [Mycobacteriales bacterium]
MGTAGVLRAPLTRRAWSELAFCLLSVPLALAVLAIPGLVLGFMALLVLIGLALNVMWVAALAFPPGVLLVVSQVPRLGRPLAAGHRWLAARLLGEDVPAPSRGRPRRRGPLGWLAAGPRDLAGWRAVGYLLVKLPLAVVFEAYAAFLWVAGVVDLSYPFWWGMFRNHPPGARLSAVPAFTPFPGRAVHTLTFAGTFRVFAIGAAMLLAAPWVTRAVVGADRWLLRNLLGPGRLERRVRDLEETRALAVDDAAAVLRRLERDLHDGAQVRLATLAMDLGMAREKLGEGGGPLDVAAARELLDTAHQGAKKALGELRDLARGIHPPVLDNGLADALATLAASGATPVELRADIPTRPTPAIETIAYFCAAELLANAAKHSHADRITVEVVGRADTLLLRVTDDGVGGADPARGSGLAGLAQRVSTVDGRLDVASPPGGPTVVTATLPLRA